MFKMSYFGLYTGPESFSLMVDRFFDNSQFKVSSQLPHVPDIVAMEIAGGSHQH